MLRADSSRGPAWPPLAEASREPTRDQPEAEPLNRKGSQSWSECVSREMCLEEVDVAYISCTNNLALGDPEKIGERQDLGADVEDGMGRLSFTGGVGDGDGRVMTDKGEGVSGGTEGDVLDPASGLIEEFAGDGVEGQAFSPDAGLRSLVDALDEGAQDSGVSVGAAEGEEDTVGVPCDTGDGAAERLLQVLRNPPIVLFLKVADGGDASTTAHRKLGLARAPSDASGCSVNAQQDEGGAPCAGG